VASTAVNANAFWAVSDARIKTGVRRVDDRLWRSCLEGVQVCTYNYIDVRKRREHDCIGVVAQHVERSVPGAISRQASTAVPSVYRLCACRVVPGAEGCETQLEIDDLGAEEAPAGAVLQLCRPDGSRFHVRVRERGERTTVTLTCSVTGSAASEQTHAGVPPALVEVFVFGQVVDDFRAVDYNQLFTASFAATQHLLKRDGEKDAVIAALTRRLEALEALEALKTP
jgi:hypothetical protein